MFGNGNALMLCRNWRASCRTNHDLTMHFMIHDSFFQNQPFSTKTWSLYLAYLIQQREVMMSPFTGFLFICRIVYPSRFFGTAHTRDKKHSFLQTEFENCYRK